VLLSRTAKRAPRMMGALACALVALNLLDVWWLTVPSVRQDSADVLWLAPLAAVALAAVCVAVVERGGAWPERPHV
jgi:hypothetical protein